MRRRVRLSGILFWIFLPINALIIASTVVLGYHYVLDVLAGAALVALVFVLIRAAKVWAAWCRSGPKKNNRMSRQDALAQTLPIAVFLRALARKGDPLAICLAGWILFFSIFILLLPVSRTVQEAAARRFQLAGVPFAGWAVFQPLPSMYNFENRWDVTFTPSAGAEPPDESCRLAFHGFINHHIFNRVLVQRAALERCGLPALLRFQTTYRGMTVESRYVLTRGPGLHGFIVTPRPE